MSSNTLFQQVLNFFDNLDWEFSRPPNEASATFDFLGSQLRWNCQITYLEEQSYLLFYSYFSEPIPTIFFTKVSTFVHQSNVDMIYGNFEWDPTNEILRFKTSIWVDEPKLSNAILRQLVFTNLNIADEYFISLNELLTDV